MIGLGTLINTGAIVAGGLIGLLFGKNMKERIQETLQMACGVSTLVLGFGGAIAGMLSYEEGVFSTGHAMFIVLCLALGGWIGEWINIEKGFENFGEWLKKKTGNSKDTQFVDGFLISSLTVCIGAMAIVGSIQDGIYGDYTILATKGILDFVIIMVLTCSKGKGCIFSAIPVFLLQGSMTLLASLIRPLMTEPALANLSLIGNILIACVGINLVWGKKVRVANLLPALIFAVAAAFVPWF